MFSESRFDDYPQLTRSTPRTSLHVQGRIAPARKAGSMRAKPVTAFSVRKTASKERSVVVMATDRSDAPEEGFVASTDGPTLGGFALPSAKSMALAVTGVTAAFVAQPMHILQMAFAGNGGDGASGGGDGGDGGSGGNGWGVPAAYASDDDEDDEDDEDDDDDDDRR